MLSIWNSTCQEAFNQLKMKLISAPILAYYEPELSTRVEIDTSNSMIAGILSQLQKDKEWHPVAYYSYSMSLAEQNYIIHNKEMLAIIRALEEWRLELVRLQREDQFKILSNHRALEYFMTTKKLNARQARWYEFLHDYYFILKYRPGKVNLLANTLTRREGAVLEKNLDHQYQTLLTPDVLDPQIIEELKRVEITAIHESISVMARLMRANQKAGSRAPGLTGSRCASLENLGCVLPSFFTL
jgi:hypothetical protein